MHHLFSHHIIVRILRLLKQFTDNSLSDWLVSAIAHMARDYEICHFCLSSRSALETDLITAYKLIYGMMGISAEEEVSLALSSSNTRGGGIRLQQQFSASVSVASRFESRAVAEWNLSPLDKICCQNLSSFKSGIR